MKKGIGMTIALALIVVGIVGVLCTALPSASEEYRIVNKYIKAVDACDFEKVKECLPLAELEQAAGVDLDAVMQEAEVDASSKLSFLRDSGLSASYLIPEDAKSVEEITLISCMVNSQTGDEAQAYGELLSVSGASVTGIVKVTYVNARDETVSVTSREIIHLINTAKGVKIVYA